MLRSYHFFKENLRVEEQIKALSKDDLKNFLMLVNKSGNSSFKFLQNIYSPSDVNYQPISLALALTEEFIDKIGEGACRIHGGGFEGTIQVFIPKSFVSEFKEYIEMVSNSFKVLELSIRQIGTAEVTLEPEQ